MAKDPVMSFLMTFPVAARTYSRARFSIAKPNLRWFGVSAWFVLPDILFGMLPVVR
jgi:hypothetical protein